MIILLISIGWKAISEDYIKYYDYDKFNNRKGISSGSFGKVSRANWKNFDTVMILKDSYKLTIKEIVNEVNIVIYYYIFFFYQLVKYINLFKNITDKNATRSWLPCKYH